VSIATLTYDTLRFAEFEDFPETSEPVWILGRKYSISTEKDEILSDVASRLWFTYRKNFPAIGEYPHGQHMTIQACSLRRELDSRLHTPDVCLFVVLVMAACTPQVAEGLPWCGSAGPDPGLLTLLRAGKSWLLLGPKIRILSHNRQLDIWNRMEHEWCVTTRLCLSGRLCRAGLPCAGAAALPADPSRHCNGFPAAAEVSARPWRPLVLLIPLRLGLTDINEAYVETLKHCFMMPQSLGVIGGKPNSAHYFIGYVGEELIYLDPHTTQPAVELADGCFIPDESFHCQHPPSRMGVRELDPSIAVGFFCQTEDDFNDWCQHVRKLSLLGGALPMFELVDRQPSHLACPDVLNLSLGESGGHRATSQVRAWRGRCDILSP
ncbi:ATG4B protease, partial [Crocuta crocuta]